MNKKLLMIPTLLAALCPALIAQTIRLAAAADLSPVLPPILADFQKETGIPVDASYQATATLVAQIKNGAPYDMFLSADLAAPRQLIAAGFADSTEPIIYARGTLVLWTRNDSRFATFSLDTLRDTSLKSIAIANPSHAPYGAAAMSALTQMGLLANLRPKLVIGENVAQAAQYADSGNAEVGLISLTSAMSDRLSSTGKYLIVPRESYPPIIQGAVVLRGSKHKVNDRRMIEFLLSPQVQHQLSMHGLMPSR